jgi:CubicO group peptidase (beta-lactamase class C family)
MTKAKPQTTADMLLEGFNSWLEDEMEAWKIPGVAVAVVYKGEVVLCKGYGFRDVEKQLPVTPETLFAIGSCTKAFVTFDIALLVQEGKLNWDTPVRHYLPTFKLYDPVATEQATPRDITSHKTGLPRHDFAWYGSSYNRDDLFDRLQYLQPNTPFRSRYYYQNLMYMTAGILVGRVAGTSWEQFTQERILDRLGMKDTNLSVNESQKSTNASLPYAERNEKVVAIPFRNLDNAAPAGSINSNLVDMLKWLKLHMTGKHEGEEILPFTAIKETHTPQTISPITPDLLWSEYHEVEHTTYALGWGVQTYRGHTMIRHTGGIDGFISAVSFLPHEDIGVILLTNLDENSGANVIHYHLYDRLLGLELLPWRERIQSFMDKQKEQGEKAKQETIASAKPDTSLSRPLADYAGTYEHPAYGKMTVTYDGDRLEMMHNGLSSDLKHHHYDVFQLHGKNGFDLFLLAQFESDLKGDIQRFSAQLEPMVDSIIFERVQAETE